MSGSNGQKLDLSKLNWKDQDLLDKQLEDIGTRFVNKIATPNPKKNLDKFMKKWIACGNRIDTYFRKNLVEHAEYNVECREGKGCSFCCADVPVLVYWFEIIYIGHIMLDELEPTAAVRIIKNITRNSKELETDNPAEHKNKCPFLVDDACAIYKYRPLNCKTLFGMGCAEQNNACVTPREQIQAITKRQEWYDTAAAQAKLLCELIGTEAPSDVMDCFIIEESRNALEGRNSPLLSIANTAQGIGMVRTFTEMAKTGNPALYRLMKLHFDELGNETGALYS